MQSQITNEDDPNDLELNVYNLEENSYKLEYDCVDQESDFLDLLRQTHTILLLLIFNCPDGPDWMLIRC